MGGVVNIITKKPTEDWAGALTAEYRGIEAGEEGDQQRVSASATGALSDAVGLSISGEFSDRDAWFRNSAADPAEVPGLEEKKTASLVTTTSFKINDVQSLDLDITVAQPTFDDLEPELSVYLAQRFASKGFAEKIIHETRKRLEVKT